MEQQTPQPDAPKSSTKDLVIGLTVLLLLAFGVWKAVSAAYGWVTDPTLVAERKAAAEQARKQSELREKEEQARAMVDFRHMVSSFERQFNETVRPCDDASDAASTSMTANSASVYAAYSAVSAAVAPCTDAQVNFSTLANAVPEGLPKQVRSDLEDAAREMSTACYVRKSAFKAMMEFLDTAKPSAVETFKEKMASYNSRIATAASKIRAAKGAVGLS